MADGMIPKGSIKLIGETFGADITDDISLALAKDVEYRIREILQEAVKFMRHSKRDRLCSEDINNAMRLRNVEVLYGYSTKNSFKFKSPLGYRDLFYIEDEDLDIEALVDSSPLPPPEDSDSYKVGWLEHSLVESNPTDAQSNNDVDLNNNSEHKSNENDKEQDSSKEFELYFQKLIAILFGYDSEAINTALSYLSKDSMTQNIVSNICRYIIKHIKDHSKKLNALFTILKTIQALVKNPNIVIDHHLNEIVTIVLTCLLGRKLGSVITEDHWTLRDFAANLLSFICERWGYEYSNLQSRILKTLSLTFLDLKKPLPSLYGSIVGLTKMGQQAIQLVLIPNLRTYYKYLQPAIEQYENPLKRLEAERVHQALFISCGIYLFDSSFNDNTESSIAKFKNIIQDENTREKLKEDENMENVLKDIENNDLMSFTKNYGRFYEIFGENMLSFVTRREDPGTELFL